MIKYLSYGLTHPALSRLNCPAISSCHFQDSTVLIARLIATPDMVPPLGRLYCKLLSTTYPSAPCFSPILRAHHRQIVRRREIRTASNPSTVEVGTLYVFESIVPYCDNNLFVVLRDQGSRLILILSHRTDISYRVLVSKYQSTQTYSVMAGHKAQMARDRHYSS